MPKPALNLPQMKPSSGNSAGFLSPLDTKGWLAEQPEDFRDWIAGNGVWRIFGSGKVIYLAGDEPDGFYGLGDGALELTFPLIGNEPVTVHRGEPGFWIGDAALLSAQPRMITICAAKRSRVFCVKGSAIRALLERRPDYWRPFYALSYSNTMTALRILAEVLSLRPRARLARLLLRLADPDGVVAGSNEEFARLLGMTRSSMQRAVRSLVDDKAIETGYGQLVIIDRPALERISNEA